MRKMFGWIRDNPDQRDLRLGFQPAAVPLPKKVDLRKEVPLTMLNQHTLGSCTANAIASAFEYAQKKNKIESFVGSRLFLYYNEREILGTTDEDSGAVIRDGMKSINKLGLCPESEWEYRIERFTQRPPNKAYSHALFHQSIKYMRITQTATALKSCLAAGYPFVFGFTVYESFDSPEVMNKGVVPMPKWYESCLGGHAVLCVGYDDAKQRFIVQNSWGTVWGDKGFCYMPYRYLTNRGLAADFWTLQLVEDGSEVS